jgi:RNA polymerase sigma factor (sigma-70 family)
MEIDEAIREQIGPGALANPDSEIPVIPTDLMRECGENLGLLYYGARLVIGALNTNNHIIKSNAVRVSFARNNGSLSEFGDFVQTGFFALPSTLADFNPDLGTLSTLALPRITNAMVRYAAIENMPWPLPVHAFEKSLHGTLPLPNITYNEQIPSYEGWVDEDQQTDLTVEIAVELAPLEWQHDAPDSRASTELDIVEARETILRLMNDAGLPDRSKNILFSYFGLSEAPKTFREIGLDYKLTHQRIQQIVSKSLGVLRDTYNRTPKTAEFEGPIDAPEGTIVDPEKFAAFIAESRRRQTESRNVIKDPEKFAAFVAESKRRRARQAFIDSLPDSDDQENHVETDNGEYSGEAVWRVGKAVLDNNYILIDPENRTTVTIEEILT